MDNKNIQSKPESREMTPVVRSSFWGGGPARVAAHDGEAGRAGFQL